MNAAVLRWLPLPILAVGALAAILISLGRSKPEPSETETLAPRVLVVEAQPGRHEASVRTHGSVEARTEIDLVAEIAGRVVWVSPQLETGSFFDAAELLVRLDDRDAALALERAEGTLVRTRSEAALARSRLKRLQALKESDISSSSELEAAEHELARTEGSLREARAARDQAHHDLERTRIHAPFAGRVREKRCDIGQFVARGTPLARLYAVDYAEVRLPIPSAELAFLDLSLGRRAVTNGAGPRVVLRADFAGRPVEWPARVVRAEGEIAARSRMLNLVARVDDPYGLESESDRPPLTVGLFVEAEIQGRRLEDVVVLPRSALRGRSQVFVVEEGRLRHREVALARLDGERAVVAAGLEPGDLVAISAASAVAGQQVRVTRVAPDAPEAALAGLSE